ncbi:MAG: hypothetical protein IT275_09130 [Chitinophagales bacterium]|nr:hypothetical protein [Chitinophagales bacterium]
MKKIKIFSFVVFGSMLIASCSSTSLNKINTSVYDTRQQKINKNSIPYNPVVVDLVVDINKKVSGSNLRQVDRYTDYELQNAKEAALYNAMTNSGADVIIDPIYKINISNNDGRDAKITIQTEVTGFYAKYTNAHKADANEIQNLKILNK